MIRNGDSMVKSVLDYLNDAVDKQPDKIIYGDIYENISYRDFQVRCREIASEILSYTNKDGKLVRRKPIIVFQEKTAAALTACLAITYSGNIYLPFDVNTPVERLNKIVDVMQPIMVLTDKQNREKAQELNVGCIVCIEECVGHEIEEEYLAKIEHEIIDTDPLYIICTSGSTGIPKGVVIPHRAVIDLVEESAEAMELSDKEIFANQAPFYFDASVPDIYCTLKNMATLYIIPQKMFSFPIKVLEFMKERGVNAMFWSPSALILIANLRALKEVDMTQVKKIMFCGEVMPVKQLNMWKKYVPDAMYVNYYGPSETTYASTYYIIDREFKNDEMLPIGKANLNTDVLILNEKDEETKVGEIGELCIRGSSLALGYYNNPEKTAESFVYNPLQREYPEIIYRTGDLVRINDLDEIEYVSRKDFQIKHQGYRIELGEIETAASSIRGMRRVCSLYNDKKKMIVLVFEGDVKEQEIREHLKSKLPTYMIPGKIYREESMPTNANGKIDRVKLKGSYGE